MSVQQLAPRMSATGKTMQGVLGRIAARAGELDRKPRFPTENFVDLTDAGALAPSAHGLAHDVWLVRAVAAVDASTARILDGHLNGSERLALCTPDPLRSAELAQIREGHLLLGVWGADPVAAEGSPAHIARTANGAVLRGVKTFCSGAGGVQRALVIATDPENDGARRLAYLDVSSHVSIDRGWYRASGLRSSESHRVEFHNTPILALLGGPGELSREPYFSRDAIRTSATWAGLADCILQETVHNLDRRRTDDVQAHALGRMRVARATIDRWLEHAVSVLDLPSGTPPQLDPAALTVECRVALSECAQLISAEAPRVCGSRPLVAAGTLDRARRDLDLFLRQHRLDPKLVGLGLDMLAAEDR